MTSTPYTAPATAAPTETGAPAAGHNLYAERAALEIGAVMPGKPVRLRFHTSDLPLFAKALQAS